MGQKANPISNRLGIIKGWDSNWYGGRNYGDKIAEDDKIRQYLNARLVKASISKIVIERTLKLITVTINTSRPGIIIGKKGADIENLKSTLSKMSNLEVFIDIKEVRKPEIEAKLVAENIANQLERRISFRRAMKKAIQQDEDPPELRWESPEEGWIRLKEYSAKEGKLLLKQYGCASCHSIPGVKTLNTHAGPGLQEWKDRHFIAGQVVNYPNNLVRWLMHPEEIDSTTLMPNLGVSEEDAWKMSAYLMGLEE